MKRKIFSLILVFMLLPFASLFSACGKDGYNLNHLANDFYAIADENENIKLVNGKLVFDYSNHQNLNNVVEYKYPYTQLNEYNEIYENIMAFSFEYIDECSNNNAVKNVTAKNNVQADLREFKNSIKDINSYVNMLAEIINVAYNNDVNSTACLARYENLLVAYEDLYLSAIKLNRSLFQLYFNDILVNGNPNIVEIDSAEFDVNVVVNNFDARLKYQMLNLSECFVEMYMLDSKIASNIIDGTSMLDLYEYNYQPQIDSLKKSFDEQVAAYKANTTTNKQKYYELSIQAYNCQVALGNDMSKFVHACGDVSYASVDLTEATANEKLCVEIIKSRFDLVTEYNNILAEMLEMTKS